MNTPSTPEDGRLSPAASLIAYRAAGIPRYVITIGHGMAIMRARFNGVRDLNLATGRIFVPFFIIRDLAHHVAFCHEVEEQGYVLYAWIDVNGVRVPWPMDQVLNPNNEENGMALIYAIPEGVSQAEAYAMIYT